MTRILLFLLLALISEARGADQSTNLRSDTLIEGDWLHHGIRTVVGSGWSNMAIVTRIDGDWKIAFRSTEYHASKAPTITDTGPYPVKIENGILSFIVGDVTRRFTFLISESRLVMPAIIQQKPGQWLWVNGDEKFEVKCEHDPFVVPVGSAEFPQLATSTTFYSYEEAPRVDKKAEGFFAARDRVNHLRFLERTREGYLIERFRFVFGSSSHLDPLLERVDGGPSPPYGLGASVWWQRVEQPGAGQPATQPADKHPVKDQTSPPTSKDAPR